MNRLQNIFIANGFLGLHVLVGQPLAMVWRYWFCFGKLYPFGLLGEVVLVVMDVFPLFVAYFVYGVFIPSLFYHKRLQWSLIVGCMFAIWTIMYESVAYLVGAKMVTPINYLYALLPLALCPLGTLLRIHVQKNLSESRAPAKAQGHPLPTEQAKDDGPE